MIQGGVVFPFPDGISAGGDTVISVHAKAGPQRWESLLVSDQGGGGGQQSVIGLAWRVSAAPPKPEADTDLMPWN